jgi:hypothetical protein
MKRKKAVFAAVAFAVLFPRGQAYAWGNTWMGMLIEQAVNSARAISGAFRYNAALQINNAGYDSDIYFGMLDKPVRDYTFSAGPDIRIFLPLKQRVVFDVSESPRYLFYLKTEHERALNNIFTGNVHVVFDRVYIQAGGGLTNAKERLSSELNMNIRQKEADLSTLFFWQASKGTSFALQYQRSSYRYENLTPEFPNISESLNRTESFVNFFAYLQQQSRARFYLEGQYGSYMFADELSRFKDSRSYGIYGGVDFLPPAGGFEGQTSGIRGSINLGYKRLDVLDPIQKDYSGLSGDIMISLGIMKLTALRLFFSRGPQFSVYSGQTYYLQTVYGVGLSRSLSRHVLFTYDFAYSRNDYPPEEAVGGNPQLRLADRFLTHALRLSYRMEKDLQISLLADLGRRNSKLAPRPVSDRVFIGLSLTYGYTAGRISLPAGPLF